MRLFYKPKNNGEIYAGLVAGNLEAISLLQNMAKFNARQGHGFAAEMANDLADRLRLRNAKIVGNNNKENGADREINNWFSEGGISIQSKYCKTGAKCIDSCFDKNGEYRYEGMQIEVPFDKYDDAVKAMKEKIKQGKIPGVDDPEKAKDIVRQGHYTYEQAKNIANGGNWDSIKFDAANAIVIGVFVGSISALITFAVSVWNDDDPKEAAKKALLTFMKVCGSVAVGAFLGAQLARKGAIESLLGEDACKIIAEKITGKVLNPDEATSYIAKNVAKAVPVIITTIIVVVPEVTDYLRNRISFAQLAKNLAVAGAGVAGAWAGNIAGAWAGGKIGAVVGNKFGVEVGVKLGAVFGPVGGLIGGFVGAIVAAWGAKWLADLIKDDDDKEMVRIITFEMEIFMGDFLWTSEEAEKANKKLHDNLKDGNKLKIMFASEDRYIAAQNVVIPVLEEIAESRKKIQLPQEEDLDLSQNIGKLIVEAEEMNKIQDEELDIKSKNQISEETQQNQENNQNFEQVSEQEINLSENWMFIFLRLLIKEKCPDANERILVPSAQFGKEIPAYFDGKIDLCEELKIKESKFFTKTLAPALDELAASEKLSKLKKTGTLGEFSECVCKILNEKMPHENEANEVIIPEVVDEIVDEKYSKDYSEESFWDKITGTIKSAGSELIFKALQLFYAMQNPECPIAIKAAIIAALGYFISPIDAIPDVIPFVGFADDLAAVGAALAMANMYINNEVIQKAKDKMRGLFGDDILKELN